MCTRYWQKAMAAIGRSLEGREPNALRQDLLGSCNPCMFCSGPDCQLCKDCNKGALRYATMFTEHTLRVPSKTTLLA